MPESLRSADVEGRAHPRVHGVLHLRWTRAAGAGAAEAERAAAWAAGGAVLALFRAPDPHISFSITGFAFDDELCADEGDALLLELAIPGVPGAFRCTARIVRRWRIPIDERDDLVATHRYACAFDALPEGARDALHDYTRRILDSKGRL